MKHFITGLTALFLSVSGTAVLAQGYGLKPGDTLRVEVLEDPSLNRDVLVLPDGSISFPFVGSVRVGGQSTSAVRGMLARGLAPNFAVEPNVFVSVSRLSVPEAGMAAVESSEIYAMGELNNPGLIQATPGITVLQAIAQAGGFTRFAATKRIELRRPEAGREQVYKFNYKRGGGISGATVLKPGDVIVVPERGLFE